jgi:hypothetical protein
MSNRDELAGMLAGVVNGPETGSPITRAMADAISLPVTGSPAPSDTWWWTS